MVVFTIRNSGKIRRIISARKAKRRERSQYKKARTFPFERARRVTAKEVGESRKAIEKLTGRARPARGRPPKNAGDKYLPISIRLHPQILDWAKRMAREKGVGYQTVLNTTLLKHLHQ